MLDKIQNPRYNITKCQKGGGSTDKKEYTKAIVQVLAYNLITLPIPKDDKMPTTITMRIKYPNGEVGYEIDFGSDLEKVKKAMGEKNKRKGDG